MSEPYNEPAFPNIGALADHQYSGMSLRDYFAGKAPSDEIQELQFRHLSPSAMEMLTGMKRPDGSGGVLTAEQQIAKCEFYAAVTAKLRFMHADAMLRARDAGSAK